MIYAILPQKLRERFRAGARARHVVLLPGGRGSASTWYMQRDAIGAAFRVIPFEIKQIDELGRPPSWLTSLGSSAGFVVDRSDRLGEVDHARLDGRVVNTERKGHIMTVEDPIEFLHKHKSCIVNQREVGADTHGFERVEARACGRPRRDPVGEMRDLETISTAITAAETGHLVFATLHTQDALQTIDRIIDVFLPHQQQQVRVQLSTTLQGVLTQQLIPTADGQGRVAACEVLVTTPAVRNLIREGKVHQIYSSMQAVDATACRRWTCRWPST